MSNRSCQKLKLCLCAAVYAGENVGKNFSVVDSITTQRQLTDEKARELGIEEVIAASETALAANKALNEALISFGVKVTES